MREVTVEAIARKVKELFLAANTRIGADILEALEGALGREKSPLGRSVLSMILENNRLAAQEGMAVCQDTGLAVVFVKLGQEVLIRGGGYQEAINRGVEEAYREGCLRLSVVDDPLFERRNTLTNTPAVVYTDLVPGDRILIRVTAKGFGSENMSALGMLKPADGPQGVIDFIVTAVKNAGPNPCPPTVVGVGIGGTADRAMVMAKEATLRRLGRPHPDERYARLEAEALKRINALGIGPAGLGGSTTALAVHIETMPTHIAGLPVAVNLCCHAARHAEGSL